MVLRLNRAAIAELPQATERRLEIISGATHLFEEPGTLDQVAALALNWFQRHLTPGHVPVAERTKENTKGREQL